MVSSVVRTLLYLYWGHFGIKCLRGECGISTGAIMSSDDIILYTGDIMVSGVGEDIVFYRGGSQKVNFFSLQKYKQTLESHELYKPLEDRKTMVRWELGFAGCKIVIMVNTEWEMTLVSITDIHVFFNILHYVIKIRWNEWIKGVTRKVSRPMCTGVNLVVSNDRFYLPWQEITLHCIVKHPVVYSHYC